MTDREGAFEAAEAFARARRKANLRSVLATLGAQQRPLLSYDDVRRRLRAVEGSLPVLEDVPLDAIVGSVGRYNDFTREFLPRVDADKARWVGVSVAMTGPMGTPPVELYRIGDAYFVRDGNHRVSVARQLGAPSIQAYVTPVYARVPLSPDVDPSRLIVLEEQARFLEATGIDELRPGADLRVSVPGAFDALREHIAVHRYFMGIDEGRPVEESEAVAHWYDAVYLPVVAAIRSSGALRDFPGRTETDLYLWLSQHRGRLERELGFALPSEAIAEAIASDGGDRFDARQREALLDEVRARAPGDAPATSIAHDVLVCLPDRASGRRALEQALTVAALEGSRVYALLAVDDGAGEGGTSGGGDGDEADADTDGVAGWRAEVRAAAAAAGVPVQVAVSDQDPVTAVRERAPWVDLVVVPFVDRPTGDARPDGRFLGVLRRSPRPVLAVIGAPRQVRRVLLAYDGGSRADQALFVAAYLAARHGAEVVVVTVGDVPHAAQATLDDARAYLERFGVRADYVMGRGAVAEAIVRVAAERDCDLLLMGSYRYSRWLEALLGGVLERTLALAGRPVLVL